MGLESATYLSGLTPSWPPTTDLKAQGDDHIRLIKTTLQNTFPNATRPFYFPQVLVVGGTRTLDSAYDNSDIICDTAAGSYSFTLPTLDSTQAGFRISFTNVNSNVNAALVVPASGTILTKVGSVGTVRVGVPGEPVRFVWSGSNWFCLKSGPSIGSVEEFDGATLPGGYLWSNGASFDTTAFAELFLVLGVSHVVDRGSRITVARDTMGGAGANNFITAGVSGVNAATLGATGGDQRIPTHSHPNSIAFDAVAGHTHAIPAITQAQFAISSGGSGPFLYGASIGGGAGINTDSGGAHTPSGTLTNANNTSGGSAANIPPVVVANKIVRAC